MARVAETIGYYTVMEDQDTGWTGGLLLLNQAGRPLEFQCTLPVRPTRAHEILFGATLREHLITEVIGKLLVDKCRNPISLLCCDLHEGIALSEFCSFPVIYLDESDQEHDEIFEQYSRARSSQRRTSDSASTKPTSILERLRAEQKEPAEISMLSRKLELSGASVRVSMADCERVQTIISGLSDLPDGAEPFERIREAIREAQSQISPATQTRSPNAA